MSSLQIKVKARTDFKAGLRETKEASTQEVRDGTFVRTADVRFFGPFLPSLLDKQLSIPKQRLGEVMEIIANAYNPLE